MAQIPFSRLAPALPFTNQIFAVVFSEHKNRSWFNIREATRYRTPIAETWNTSGCRSNPGQRRGRAGSRNEKPPHSSVMLQTRHRYTYVCDTLHKATPAAEQIEFFQWTLWIHNHHCHHCNSNQGWIISFHITLKMKWNVKMKVIEKAPSTSFYPRINLTQRSLLLNKQTIWSHSLADARSLIDF